MTLAGKAGAPGYRWAFVIVYTTSGAVASSSSYFSSQVLLSLRLSRRHQQMRFSSETTGVLEANRNEKAQNLEMWILAYMI